MELEQQKFNLYQFINEFILPAQRDITAAAGRPGHQLQWTARATLFEAICWIKIGTSLGHFPRSSVEAVFREKSSPLLDGLDVFLNRWPYLLNSFWVPELQQLQRRKQSTYFAYYFDTEGMATVFQNALGRALRFNRDLHAQSFTLFTNFLHPTEFHRALTFPASTEETLNVMEDDGGVSQTGEVRTTAVYLGFLNALGYLEGLRDSYLGGMNDPAVDSSDMRILTRNIAQIQQWRFFALMKQSAHSGSLLHRLATGVIDVLDLAGTRRAEDILDYASDLLNFYESFCTVAQTASR